MAKRVTPTSFTAGRTITLNGTTYAPGAAIPVAVVKAVKSVNALLSRGWIKTPTDYYGRTRVRRHPAPRTLTPYERR